MSAIKTPVRRPPTTVEVDLIDLGTGAYCWAVISDCGVVKVYSSRDGCMIALAPDEARRVGDAFATAMHAAADTTEMRCFGKVSR